MNAIYRTLALICAALVVAIATFKDSFALTIGALALITIAVIVLFVLAGAALSVMGRAKEGPAKTPATKGDVRADIDHSRPST